MNISVGKVNERLEERVRRGRTPAEAAGEMRWLVELEEYMGILSTQTTNDVVHVVDEWLAAKVGVPIGELGPYSMAATMYAQFLSEKVSIEDPLASVRIDTAWHQWREIAKG